MKYKILQENFNRNLKDIVLENRELTKSDVNFLLNPSSEYLENPFKIKNMSEAITLFINELDNESKIGIVPDCDVDGYTSSALLYLFLVNECEIPRERIQIFYHEGKMHGLDNKIFKEIKKSDINFLIMADAGSNDINEIKELMKIGKKILILDHHTINDDEQNSIFQNQNGDLVGVIVNNQLDEYSNNLAGVGVVYKFLNAMTEDELTHYTDLVALGNIADSMYLNDYELRYIVDKGLKNIDNELIKEFMIDAKLEGNITPTDVSFNIANKINAVIRYGNAKEKEDLFRALIGEQEEIKHTPRKSRTNPNPTTEIQTLQKAMVRISKSIKQKQDNAKKRAVEKCKQFVEENDLGNNKAIVIIDEKGELIDRKITGLICMSLVDVFKKSVVVLSKSKEKYVGSMRGYGVDSLKEILESTEIIKVIGHHNAAGVEVEFKDIPRLIKRINRVFEDIEIVPPYTLVDCQINTKSLKEKDMLEVFNMKPIWHSHCGEPLFLLKNVIVESKKVRNPYTTLLVFDLDGIEIKKEYCSKVFKEEFLKENVVKFGKPTLECDLIVKIGYDDYKRKPCLIIVEAESKVVEKKENKNIPF